MSPPNPRDTQYPYPTPNSPFVIMKYGDEWGIYDRRLDAMVLAAAGEHPFSVRDPNSCETAIRMMLRPEMPGKKRIM